MRYSEEGPLGRNTTIIAYGGIMDGVYARNFDIAFYDAINDKWGFAFNQGNANNNVQGTIKCEATIRYCEGE